MHSRYRIARTSLIILLVFTGIAALYGSFMMLIAPDGSLLGMEDTLKYIQKLPLSAYLYQSYIFPGVCLLTIIGIPHFAASIYLLRKKESCRLSVIIPGIILMLWIILQFIIIPGNALSIITFIIAEAEAAIGYAAFVFGRQETMEFDADSYCNIGKNSTNAVVYFSRLGYTRKLAYEEADRTGAAIIEIRAKERTKGTCGFWWCGRYGMHRWSMPIEHIDLSDYKYVTICSPIWVFGIAAPVRSLINENRGKIQNAKLILNHFQPVSYKTAAIEICNILNVYDTEVVSVDTRLGKTRKKRTFIL